eukprot:364886-Chlamydomonas_euryale.AAC.6
MPATSESGSSLPGGCAARTTGTPAFMIPALAAAIERSVPPSAGVEALRCQGLCAAQSVHMLQACMLGGGGRGGGVGGLDGEALVCPARFAAQHVLMLQVRKFSRGIQQLRCLVRQCQAELVRQCQAELVRQCQAELGIVYCLCLLPCGSFCATDCPQPRRAFVRRSVTQCLLPWKALCVT